MSQSDLQASKILIVDDEEATVQLLESILRREGFRNVHSVTDSRQVLPLFSSLAPDLILLDLNMPHFDGFEVMKQLRGRIPYGTYFPILVLTADIAPEAKLTALSMGAKDFLTKPFDRVEVLLRIANLLETRRLTLLLQDQHQALEARVRERTRELEATRIEVLERLALAAEFRDDVTGQHTKRVGETSGVLASALKLPDEMVEMIRRAAPLHDIGKIGISDLILLKRGALTPEEFEVMKTHTTIGAKIQSGSFYPLLQMAEEIALTHHEKWDGTGYAGLQGEAIPLLGRIVAVADVFDALTHVRPYKPAFPAEKAFEILRDGAGKHFDPTIVEAFFSCADEILSIHKRFNK